MKFNCKHIASSIVALLYASEAAATACKATDPVPPLAPQFIMTPVQQNSGILLARELSGTLTPLDGCRFQMSNFSISPPCVGTYFYGLALQGSAEPYIPRLGLAAIGGAVPGINQTFSLVSAKWSEMKGIGVYCENDGVMLMQTLWVPDAPVDSGASASGGWPSLSALAVMGMGSLFAFLMNEF